MKNNHANELIKAIRSGVIHVEFLNSEGKIIGSGSGFISKGLFITNNHVYKGILVADNVQLSWQSDISIESRNEIILTNSRFRDCFVAGSDEDNFDYAILDIPELRDKKLYNFTIQSNNISNIFDETLILGFPLEHRNLVCHKATISSFFTKNNANIIQLDASVNSSNSGGPLVNLSTGEVIGIVTRKGTGLTSLFDELMESFDQNIAIFRSVGARVLLGNIDPIHSLNIAQSQMKALAVEIFRSANVGIGYAFSIEHVRDDLDSITSNKGYN